MRYTHGFRYSGIPTPPDRGRDTGAAGRPSAPVSRPVLVRLAGSRHKGRRQSARRGASTPASKAAVMKLWRSEFGDVLVGPGPLGQIVHDSGGGVAVEAIAGPGSEEAAPSCVPRPPGRRPRPRRGCVPARLDGCQAVPHRQHSGSQVIRQQWFGCARGTSVVLYTIVGGGHTWPGADPRRGVGLTTQQVSASFEILSFFNGFRS